MKKITLTLFSAVLMLLLISCESDISKVVMSADPIEPVLENLTLNVAFNIDNAEEEITINWSEADYGFSASVNYSIQIDNPGLNFVDALELASASNSSSATFKVKDLNKKMLDLGLTPDTEATVELRIKSTVNDNVDPVYSNAINVTVTPFQTDFEPIYMIGTALKGWDTSLAVEVQGIAPGVYETTALFTKSGHFRFFSIPDWGAPNQWGYTFFTGEVTELLQPEYTHSDPNYRFDGGTGNYKIHVDLNTKSISMELQGDVLPEQPEDYVFGIVGTAYEVEGVVADWGNNDVDDAIFTFASSEGEVYTYSMSKLKLLADGEFKIRKDRDWTVNYGYADVTIEGDPDNFIDAGGNIKVVATKTYAIDFILDVANNTKTLVLTERGEYPTSVFLVGSLNGWDNNGLYMAAMGSDVHTAYQYLDDATEFKILIARGSWDGAWGVGANAGEIADGGNNIVVSALPTYTGPGFYEIKADLPNGTIALTSVTMGVIGDAQAGGWDTDVNLNFNESTKVWEGQVTFLATGSYKFRANDDWAINFGGSLDNLVHNGDNIATPGEGTYNIVLDLSGANAFTATVTQ